MSLKEKNLVTARQFQAYQKVAVERAGIINIKPSVLAGDSDMTRFFRTNQTRNLSTNTANYFKEILLEPEIQVLKTIYDVKGIRQNTMKSPIQALNQIHFG
jgi:hypothetical protein